MKKIVLISMVICLLAGVAQGVTKVYPIAELFSGSSTGISATFVNGTATVGDTTIASAGDSEILRAMRVDFKPDNNVTGTINFFIGSAPIYSIHNALADNVYGKNLNTNFNKGSAGDDLIINVPSGTTVRYNADYRVD